MKIEEIMTLDPACCEPETDLQEVARLMIKKNCGAIPIIENQKSKKLVGIITDRDIVVRTVAEGKSPLFTIAKDIMTENVLRLTPEASLEECCELMEKNQVRRIVVVDEDGACIGIVAQADIARKAPQYEISKVVKDISETAKAATL